MCKNLREVIFSEELKMKYKEKISDFTRERKQNFSSLILFMLNNLQKSLSIEIDNFITHLTQKLSNQKIEDFTKSAFVQNRNKLKPEVFKDLFNRVTSFFYDENHQANIKTFHGKRVLAVDGSTTNLPDTPLLKEIFGESKNQTQTSICQARISMIYDVLNNLILDAKIGNLSLGERELACSHFQHIKPNDLVIYDRGYPSYDFVYQHIELGCDYLFRVKINHSTVVAAFVKSGEKSQIVEIFPNQKRSLKDKKYDKNSSIKVRLVRVELAGNEVEILLTSLIDTEEYPNKIFKELYFKRWKIETLYDELKTKLKVENFTGYSEKSILQDFYCAVFISNFQSIILHDLEVDLKQKTQDRKYEYKINTNLSYGFLKNRILELLHQNGDLEKVFEELKILFLKETIPIRNNRNIPRNVGKYRTRLKPKVTKNHKDAI